MFDYAEMLVKYIAHVAASEGVEFILSGGYAAEESRAQFTAEEWAELERLAVISRDREFGR